MTQTNYVDFPDLPTKAPDAQRSSGATIADITSKSRGLPDRIIFHALPGLGKTSLAARFPKPVFIMDAGETGLETLIDSGQIPETPHFPPLRTWREIHNAVDALLREPHDFETLCIDTLGGFERLMHEHVCRRDFSGDWGERGFASYQRGYEVALADWTDFLARLDRLREDRRMTIVALAHSRVTPFRNPEDEDYDRFEPDLHRKTWAMTHRWSDLILFGNFVTAVRKDGGRGKGRGGSQRMLYTERTAAFDAKHRHGLPAQIPMGDSPDAAYRALTDALRVGRNGKSGKDLA